MSRRPEDRPLPKALAALSPGARLLVVALGILVGLGLMAGGLKLIEDDANAPASTTTTTPAGN